MERFDDKQKEELRIMINNQREKKRTNNKKRKQNWNFLKQFQDAKKIAIIGIVLMVLAFISFIIGCVVKGILFYPTIPFFIGLYMFLFSMVKDVYDRKPNDLIS